MLLSIMEKKDHRNSVHMDIDGNVGVGKLISFRDKNCQEMHSVENGTF